MANFLHGVETVEVNTGARPIRAVKAGVIGIIGTAPFGSVNEPILITSLRDADEKLGPAMLEYTLRRHVDVILAQGDATIVAVNIYNWQNQTVLVEDEVRTINAEGFFYLTSQLIFNPNAQNLVVKSMDGNTTYVRNTDYRFDEHGKITILNADLLENPNTQVKVTYRSHRASLVDDADVTGGITDGVRTGLAVFDLAKTMFNFAPKILLCPVFCTSTVVTDALISKANSLRARALVDAHPQVMNTQDAISERGPSGTYNFRTGSKRAVLCYPSRLVAWKNGGNDIIGLSSFLAGVWSNTINKEGYWVSPSNHEMLGSGSEQYRVTGGISDPTGEANLLNEVGIVTHLNVFGKSPLTWGNRSAAWPTSTAVDNFLPVLLTADVIDESIEDAMLPFIDKPITNAVIDSIKETVNAFLNTLVGRGALLPGSECVYDPADNPVQELALGHLTFQNQYLPPTPAERITFKRYLYTELLANLQQQ
jgi:phage tail sheath protein FI